jgi:peptidoglycan/LPS O-acetylase OafA/YrhL
MAMQPQLDFRFKGPAGPLAAALPPAEARSTSTPVTVSPGYRADIDGLRALAVLVVILFHARVPGFGGGYVGVDVFFVISGYLITRLLTGWSPSSPGACLKTFYIRRGRRILPALLVTSIATAAVASVLLLPGSLAEFGRFLAASSLFVSNLAAWREGDYFSTEDYQPLIHFWSLAVEEQFYFAYPLLLLLLTRYLPRHRLLVLNALAVTSFAVCVWASYHKANSNFFLAPTRAWELLLGSVIALRGESWRVSKLTRELLSVLAVLALALAVLLYDGQLPYPGLATLVPCAATAILIATNGERATLVGKLLCLPPLVFTGLVSYSLYLWHLPILKFVNYYDFQGVDAVELAGSLVAIYALATLSWKVIEKPIRAKVFLTSDRTFLLTTGAVSAVLLAAGLALWVSDGLPQRFDEVDVPRGFMDEGRGGCVNLPSERIASGSLCSYGPQTATAPRALVWGDSHALALLPAYKQLAGAYDMRVYYAAGPNCRPLLGVTNGGFYPRIQRRCASFNHAVAGAIEQLNPRLVILNARWIDKDENLALDGGVAPPHGTSKFRFALEQTVRHIAAPGRSICVVLDVPTFKYHVPQALVVARIRGLSSDFLRLSRAEALQQFEGPERDFHIAAQEHLLTTVDPKDVLCRSGWCAFRSDRSVLYGDSHHLSTEGALLLVSTLEGCFRTASRDGT